MERRKTYNTKQRNAVLAFFKSLPQQSMTAQEAREQLATRGQAIGRTTIYRVIARLLEEGLLFKVNENSPETTARYQYRGLFPRNISVRCNHCGLIAALTCEAVDAFEEHLYHDHGFRLLENECILPGLCSACRTSH